MCRCACYEMSHSRNRKKLLLIRPFCWTPVQRKQISQSNGSNWHLDLKRTCWTSIHPSIEEDVEGALLVEQEIFIMGLQQLLDAINMEQNLLGRFWFLFLKKSIPWSIRTVLRAKWFGCCLAMLLLKIVGSIQIISVTCWCTPGQGTKPQNTYWSGC